MPPHPFWKEPAFQLPVSPAARGILPGRGPHAHPLVDLVHCLFQTHDPRLVQNPQTSRKMYKLVSSGHLAALPGAQGSLTKIEGFDVRTAKIVWLAACLSPDWPAEERKRQQRQEKTSYASEKRRMFNLEQPGGIRRQTSVLRKRRS